MPYKTSYFWHIPTNICQILDGYVQPCRAFQNIRSCVHPMCNSQSTYLERTLQQLNPSCEWKKIGNQIGLSDKKNNYHGGSSRWKKGRRSNYLLYHRLRTRRDNYHWLGRQQKPYPTLSLVQSHRNRLCTRRHKYELQILALAKYICIL